MPSLCAECFFSPILSRLPGGYRLYYRLAVSPQSVLGHPFSYLRLPILPLGLGEPAAGSSPLSAEGAPLVLKKPYKQYLLGLQAGNVSIDAKDALQLNGESCSFTDNLTYSSFNWLPYPNFKSDVITGINGSCLGPGWDSVKTTRTSYRNKQLYLSGVNPERPGIRESYKVSIATSKNGLLWGMWVVIALAALPRFYRGRMGKVKEA